MQQSNIDDHRQVIRQVFFIAVRRIYESHTEFLVQSVPEMDVAENMCAKSPARSQMADASKQIIAALVIESERLRDAVENSSRRAVGDQDVCVLRY